MPADVWNITVVLNIKIMGNVWIARVFDRPVLVCRLIGVVESRPKCGNTERDTGRIRAAGGFRSKMSDVRDRKSKSVKCTDCRYVEFYQADSSILGIIFDLLTN